jgi:hypothetical protein
MNIILKLTMTVVLTLSACLSAHAQAQVARPLPPQFAPPGERIIGLWSSEVDLGPCAGGPRFQGRGLNNFHAGGTLTEVGSPPPSTRGPSLGVWSFNRGNQRFEARMQFIRYLPDGSFDGITDIHRELRLSFDASQYTDEIVARLLNPDGSLRVELCGTATGTRVPIL